MKADGLVDKDPKFQRMNFCSVIRSSQWKSKKSLSAPSVERTLHSVQLIEDDRSLAVPQVGGIAPSLRAPRRLKGNSRSCLTVGVSANWRSVGESWGKNRSTLPLSAATRFTRTTIRFAAATPDPPVLLHNPIACPIIVFPYAGVYHRRSQLGSVF